MGSGDKMNTADQWVTPVLSAETKLNTPQLVFEGLLGSKPRVANPNGDKDSSQDCLQK